ncbi:MAG: hypothetical protein JNM93_13550 [Bacteriovoracaceae bacterium]|nr:hypothetical protein [Bacteriovoracaceae bacterium]
MILPAYKELLVKRSDREVIKNLLAASSIGRSPLVIKVDHLKSTQASALSILEEIFKNNNLSAHFPYPIYVLSSLNEYNGIFNLIRHMDELPKFYKKKEKTLNVKEQEALMKVKLFQNKVLNLDINEQMGKIKTFANEHKKLFLLSKEGSYYEMLLKKIKRKK